MVWDHVTKRNVLRILKSTCLIYGDYLRCRALMTAARIPFETHIPQKWIKALGIPGKGKNETKTQWKNRLKARAQQLYPRERVTLPTADALLIATHCKRFSSAA